MGIHGLNKFLESNTKGTGIKKIHYSSLQDKVVAIDISIYLYQFASAIKSSTDNLTTKDGLITTHIQAIISKTMGMLKKKIKPVFVFDGKATSLKENTLSARKDSKVSAKNELKELKIKIEETDKDNIFELDKLNEEKIKLLKKSVSVSHKQMEECKEIALLLGIPVIESVEEADPQCAWLVKNGLAYATASEDMDILTFGTNKLLRGLSAKDYLIEYDLDILLEELGLTMNQFIDVCILLGCDYTDTIIGIGPKKAYDMIKKYKSIDEMIKQDKNFKNKKFVLPENFNYEAARNYFKDPPIKEIKQEDLKWTKPKYDELSTLLKDRYEYTQDSIDKMFSILQGGYYAVICGLKTNNDFIKDRTKYIKSIKNNINFDSDSD